MSETATGAQRIAAERRRQIDREGYTPEHDQYHDGGELLDAAQEYLAIADFNRRYPEGPMTRDQALDIQDLHGFAASRWPWAREDFKPSADPIPNLVKAGALIAAEIDRLAALAPVVPAQPSTEEADRG